MKIEIWGMEEEKVDFKLKLIRSSGCFLLTAIDKNGNQVSIFRVDVDGSCYQCVDHLKELK
jgi:hypothetical protein